MFQYDTKHSNLFLSHYTNQILNAVGDDSIVRGLEVVPSLNSSKNSIIFTISPGALVQDLTYFEFQKETVIEMDDVLDFSDYYIIIYTNYRYIETVYENQLKFEVTLYNPKTRKVLSTWNPVTNRIILGVFSFSVQDDTITEVFEEDGTIFFEESNVIKNGTFDSKDTNSWTAINSTLSIEEEGGALDSPYITVTPLGVDYQGIAQSVLTKPNETYEVSFYVKSDEATPFQVLVLDKNSVYDLNATEVKNYESTSTKRWGLHTFRFNAFSTQTTLFFLKKSESLDNKISFDHISVFEYTPTRKTSDLSRISLVDGGKIPTSEDVIVDTTPESVVYQWNLTSKTNKNKYSLDNTQHAFKNPNRGSYIVFFGGSKVYEKDYYLDFINNTITFNNVIDDDDEEISIYFIKTPKSSIHKWEIESTEIVEIYTPDPCEEAFPSKENGKYFVFYNSVKLNDIDYTINPSQNTIQLSTDIIKNNKPQMLMIYYFTDPIVLKTWTFKTSVGVTSYYLADTDEDFPDGSKGKFIVFFDGVKLSEEDYLIKSDNGSISIDIVPDSNNLPLTIHYFGNEEEVDETPADDNFDVYHWKINLDSTRTTYRFDKSYQALKPVNSGSYVLFIGDKKLKPNQYTINVSSNSITFVSSAIVDDEVVDVYYIKNPAAGKLNWNFSTVAGTFVYRPTEDETVLPSPDDGTYMVFLDDKKLSKEQYNVLYTSNAIRLSNNLSIANGSILQVYCIMDPPVSNKFWKFNTIANVKNYPPLETQYPFTELPDGEFLLFVNEKKLSESEYKIDKLKNVLTFLTPPQESGGRIELYFMGKESF